MMDTPEIVVIKNGEVQARMGLGDSLEFGTKFETYADGEGVIYNEATAFTLTYGKQIVLTILPSELQVVDIVRPAEPGVGA